MSTVLEVERHALRLPEKQRARLADEFYAEFKHFAGLAAANPQ